MLLCKIRGFAPQHGQGLSSLFLAFILCLVLSFLTPLAYRWFALLYQYRQPASGAYCFRVVGVDVSEAAHAILKVCLPTHRQRQRPQ